MTSMKPITDIVTIQDIAARCGVTKRTVSRAFSDGARSVKPATLDKIMQAARELGYDPSHSHLARRLAMRKTGKRISNRTIAVFFPRGYHHFTYFNQIILGIMDVLENEAYAVLTALMGYEDEDIPAALRHGDADGIIYYMQTDHSNVVRRKIHEQANLSACPLVSLVQFIEGTSSILTDDFLGAQALLTHLLTLGHRHVLHFVSESRSYTSTQRLAGFRQACRLHTLDCDQVLVQAFWDLPNLDKSTANLQGVLDTTPTLTAIIAPNDAAAGVIAECVRRTGRRIPEDISLVGYDDTDPLLDAQGRNILTTVRLPLREMGQEATKLLLRRMAGTAEDGELVVLPTIFVERHSTAPPHERC